MPYKYNRIHISLSIITEHTVAEQMALVAQKNQTEPNIKYFDVLSAYREIVCLEDWFALTYHADKE